VEFKKRLALDLYRQHKKTQTKLHELTYLFWECTLRCNLQCLHCGSDCTAVAGTSDMPVDDFLRVLDSLTPRLNPDKVMVVLTGGEPLMRKDLVSVGKEIYRRGFPWGMVTNGFALTPARLAELLDAGLRSVTVSLDGLNAETHDWMRGRKGSFDKALDAVARIAATPDLRYDVVTCINKRNINDLEAIRDMLIGLNVKEWRLFSIFPKGRAKDNPDLKLSDDEFVRMMDFIRETRAAGVIKASYGCEGFLGEYEFEVRNSPFFCRAGINVGSVLADGSISACPSLRADYIQGNVYRDDFLTVWNERFQIMRDRSWTKTGKCADCKSWKYCEGNGLHLRDEVTGDLLCCHLEKIKNASK
jgi:radical SAM enzyme (rSAM/lipoprotein system)